MTFLIIVIILNIKVVFLQTGLSDIDSDSQSLFHPLSSMFLLLLLELFLFIFLVFFILLLGLRHIDIGKLCFFGLRLFGAEVFGNCFLGQYLCDGVIRRAITS